MGKKKKYESPYIRVTKIEVESSFAAGSLVDEKKSDIVSSGQEIGTVKDANSLEEPGFWTDDTWK